MNNYGILLNNIPYELKRKLIYLEKTCKKINNIMYNETCLKEEIMPKYSKIKTYLILHH